ncbi:PEP-CTERM/exosortase system-associated acyltransferase [Cellvibrio mixtus]|uniref:PEP-CTERM/exosortase system-associated acyltransferase n=1 Tax=Cellvibrio mixtus TaxID=39650 RepID=UPI000587AADF|nr:PEP-CTERM/exosortase system-associated acyltransferase [Cellvibrio mixtus]
MKADPLFMPEPRKIASSPAGRSSLASDEALAISKHFAQYLQPQIALTNEHKQEVYGLRHQVYCEELHFEDEKPDHIECDEFDARAIHCCIRHLGSQQLAGTLRLITTNNDNELLPLQKFCRTALTHPELHPRNFLPRQICEISRLAVPAAFRKRQTDQFAGVATGAINESTFSVQELRFFPYIAISLYMAAIAMTYKTRRFHTFVMMEPRLARSLNFVGIHFQPIGPCIDYHGQRAPFYIDSRTIKAELSDGYRKLLAIVQTALFNP